MVPVGNHHRSLRQEGAHALDELRVAQRRQAVQRAAGILHPSQGLAVEDRREQLRRRLLAVFEEHQDAREVGARGAQQLEAVGLGRREGALVRPHHAVRVVLEVQQPEESLARVARPVRRAEALAQRVQRRLRVAHQHQASSIRRTSVYSAAASSATLRVSVRRIALCGSPS